MIRRPKVCLIPARGNAPGCCVTNKLQAESLLHIFRACHQSLSQVILQIVFSTKERRPFSIRKSVPPCTPIWLPFAAIANAKRIESAALPTTCISPCDWHAPFRRRIFWERYQKKHPSAWIKTQAAVYRDFAWQVGYGAFSIGYPDLDDLIAYVDGQEEHHKVKSFQEDTASC